MQEFMIDVLKDRLHEYEGKDCYGCDLGYYLLESENANCSYFCNTTKTVEFIKQNWDDFGSIVENIEANFGADGVPNPFTEAEKFMVVCMLEYSSYLLGRCKTVEKAWDTSITLDKKTIEKIEQELDAQYNNDLYE